MPTTVKCFKVLKRCLMVSFLLAMLMTLLAACDSIRGQTVYSSQKIHPNARQVQITENDFHIFSSLKAFTPGLRYHFIIRNTGHTMHEFMITPLTLSTLNGMSMNDMDHISLADVRNIAPGHTRTLDYTFPASTAGTRLQFACHYPGHYEAGMRLNVLVKSK